MSQKPKNNTESNTKNAEQRQNKAWGGRFDKPIHDLVLSYTTSVHFDRRLYREDIAGSRAHARMLASVGVLSAQDAESILAGLDTIEQEIESDQMQWQIEHEDVHMNIEARLIQLVGEAGKRLHTGRSRNDQVATDIILYLRHALQAISVPHRNLLQALLDIATEHADSIMPGMTHLQVAQPVTFGHHMMAWFEMLLRDADRLRDCAKRMDRLPLGASALAGTSYPIDPHYTSELLAFSMPTENSLDAVSNRDHCIEFCAAAAITMMHLSRIAEELIIWSSSLVGFIELSDNFCTGSSIMPQKKNPDVPELLRGKASRTHGNLTTLLSLMKSQPLAYNKDNQEDKEPLFDSVDTLHDSLLICSQMLPQMTVNKETMHTAAMSGYSTATDLADYLVRKGMGFRDAHAVVGQVVRYAIEHQCMLNELELGTLQGFCSDIEQDVFEVLSVAGSAASRDHIGGTAPSQVRQAIARASVRLEQMFS